MNWPGSTWFLPVTDNGKLTSAFAPLFDTWHLYPIDEFNGGGPAGVGPWVREGMLELPIPISGWDQL